MAIYYVDYVNGDDSYAGDSFAAGHPWKTLTLGATAARIAPGDTIKIAKSPAPTSLGQTATWTDLSRTVTLTSAVTANIELCDAAWTASENVTATATATVRKQGTNNAVLAIAAGFTTGKVAYKALGSAIDFSGYKQVSFWIRSNLAIAAGVLTLDLCSDTLGATPVNTIAIPAIPSVNFYQIVTVNVGSALGSSIQSVSINAISDPGTVTILLDNILACKDATSADSLTLSSLISKNSLEQGGSEGWFGIKSINGTTIELDNDVNSIAGAGKGYSGTTETVTTYKRETIKTIPAGVSPIVQELMDLGTSTAYINYEGGYNTATVEQDGETFYDGSNGSGYGIYAVSKDCFGLDRINTVRYGYGLYFVSCRFIDIGTIQTCSNCSNGIYLNTCYKADVGDLLNLNNHGNIGLYLVNTGGVRNTGQIKTTNIMGTTGIYINNSFLNTLKNISSVNNVYGIGFAYAFNNTILDSSTRANSTSSLYVITGVNYLKNFTYTEATPATLAALFSNAKLYVTNYNSTGYNYIPSDGCYVLSRPSTLTNGSGTEWIMNLSAYRYETYPFELSVAKVAVSANALVTVKMWFKKSHATNVGAKLVCRGGQIAGVASDVVATKANDTNEEQLTITFTPTEAGVVEIEAQGYWVAVNGTVIVDNISITQA